MAVCSVSLPRFLFVPFDSLCPSQQFFSHAGMGLPGLNQLSVLLKDKSQ